MKSFSCYRRLDALTLHSEHRVKVVPELEQQALSGTLPVVHNQLSELQGTSQRSHQCRYINAASFKQLRLAGEKHASKHE